MVSPRQHSLSNEPIDEAPVDKEPQPSTSKKAKKVIKNFLASSQEKTPSLTVKHSKEFDFEVIVGDPNYKQIKRPSTSPVPPSDSDGEDAPCDQLENLNSPRYSENGK